MSWIKDYANKIYYLILFSLYFGIGLRVFNSYLIENTEHCASDLLVIVFWPLILAKEFIRILLIVNN